jgi:uncharacterized protein (TIGR03032 family)
MNSINGKDNNQAKADQPKDVAEQTGTGETQTVGQENDQQQPKVEYSVSGGLFSRLAKLNMSLAFSSYQSGLLYFIGRNPKGSVHIHQSAMNKPMGICMDDKGRMTLSCGFQIVRFENVLDPHERANNLFDACFVPRTVHVTGALEAHDVGMEDGERPVFVNTRFNCLSTVSPRHSFEMTWKPDFISGLVDEDRCHLNGLAMEDGKPRYATAVSRSDTIDGWRDRRSDGGIVIDIQSGKIICEGLSMPHSPRLHNGELWVLNSGTGELGVVTRKEIGVGQFEPRVFCPGFLRGLAFRGNHAFVGLSKPRYKRFEGLALDAKLAERDSEPWCGVQIIDLSTGSCVDWFRIDGNIGELYDVEVIPGFSCPMSVSPGSAEAASLVTWNKQTAHANAA